MEGLALALLLWGIMALRDATRLSRRVKRSRPGPVRDQLTPEEVETHFDALRRKRSAELKAMRLAGLSR